MSADLVNLRRFRKRKARTEREKAADANRIAFGRSKSEKRHTEAVNRKERKDLDSKRLEQDGDDRLKPPGP